MSTSISRFVPECSIKKLQEDLLKTGKDKALLHLIPDASSINVIPSSSHLPHSPLAVREEILNHLQSQLYKCSCWWIAIN
jgi:hypothetical protein